jgi:anti-sigma28 factor (negative regulator of flagellin synthesis)
MEPLDKPRPRRRTKAKANSAFDAERAKKIADIKKALDNGTYSVPDEEVARKLIEHMLEPKS